MIKVLHLIQSPGPGGAEKVLLMLVRHLTGEFEHKVGLLKPGWISQQLKTVGISPIIIPAGGSFDFKLIENLVNIIKKNRTDLVHSHLLDINFYSAIAAHVCNVPHIATEHGDIHHATKKLDTKIWIKANAISLLTNKIVFVSEFTKKMWLKVSATSPNKTSVIYNGVDINFYRERIDKDKHKRESGFKIDDIIIGNVASLYPVKGQIYILEAAKRILSIFPKAMFVFVGKGDLDESLKKASVKLGICNRVKFIGFRNDVRGLLKIMDVFVLSSISEAMPLSIIEAIACGVPVVATSVGGVPEIIDDGINGFLIPPENSEILADKTITLLKNDSVRHKMISRGYIKISHRFSLQNMIDNYKRLYLEERLKR